MKKKPRATTVRKLKTARRKTAVKRTQRAAKPKATARPARKGKPSGYSTVSPYLVVSGAQQVVDFAKKAFGATDLRRYDMPDGTIMHAELLIDDTVVMLGESGPEWPPLPTFLHVYVADVDATYRRALAAGGTAVQEPVQKEGDPDKRGGVKDPGGNTWWISTPQQ